MASIDDIELRTGDDRLLSVKDLWSVLVTLIEQDPDARAYLAELIGPVAPRGEPGPAGVAWVPDLAVNAQGCLEIVRWFEWPAEKGEPPRGVLSENGIITAQGETQHLVKQVVATLFETLVRDGVAQDEAEARRILEDNRDVIAKAIMRQGAQEHGR